MPIILYNVEDSHPFYLDYYNAQWGNGLSIYSGRTIIPQAGASLESMFEGFGRAVLLLMKWGAISLGKRLLNTGVGVAGDALHGKSVGQAALKRLKAQDGNMFGNVTRAVAPDIEKTKSRKRKSARAPARVAKKRRPAKRRNIFSWDLIWTNRKRYVSVLFTQSNRNDTLT